MREHPASGRRPDFIVPKLTCDSHCHVFGPANVFPYAPTRGYTPEDAPKEFLVALHDKLRIERAVIVQASCHGTDNRAMIDCLRSDPRRFRGVAIVDDTATDRDYREMHEAGVRGVRFNFMKRLGGPPDMSMYYRVLDRIRPLGWHVVLHLEEGDILPLVPMMNALNLTFVIDHMGRVDADKGVDHPAFRAILEIARRENCWVKVSGAERIAPPPFTAAIPSARAIMAVTPDRVLWGSDYPHPNARYPADEADLVDLLPHFGDAAALQKLLVDNPARLYDWA